ncbi:MAG: hypothetical protein PVS3B2_09760 [Candidatus Dormibacteraceae bacterium]
MPDFEQQLSQLSAQIEWPATPNLVPAVRARITDPVALRAAWYQSRWALAAAAVIVALVALIAYQPSRDTIADWVNVHVFFQRVQVVPTPSPLPAGPLGKRLGLGDQTTLAGAQQKVTWRVTVPSRLGEPDEVYLQLPPSAPAQGEVTLVYASRPNIPVAGETGVSVLVTEARGSVNSNIFGKMLGPGTTIEEVTVAGHHGFWIAGSPHAFFFLDANGNFKDETLRLATNTLVIDVDGTIVRIEGNLTKAQALEIAASLR